jgi:hypothetical protein
VATISPTALAVDAVKLILCMNYIAGYVGEKKEQKYWQNSPGKVGCRTHAQQNPAFDR